MVDSDAQNRLPVDDIYKTRTDASTSSDVVDVWVFPHLTGRRAWY